MNSIVYVNVSCPWIQR